MGVERGCGKDMQQQVQRRLLHSSVAPFLLALL
jgi:hypothetical protein